MNVKSQLLNSDIKAKYVNLVNDDGTLEKNIEIEKALQIAEKQNMDLVEFSKIDEKTSVCKILDYNKHLYNLKKSELKNKKTIKPQKEIKFRPNTDTGDIKTKVSKIIEFLESGHEVKIIVQFKGREIANKQIGYDLVTKVKNQISVEYKEKQEPLLQGKAISLIIYSNKKV